MLTVGEANQIQQEESPDSPPPAPMPRRAVPTTFNPIINDEANILAALARGDRTIPDLAEEHATTVSALCLWIQREDIQRKLADLTTCGATLTRIAAVNQLPKAVSALSFQIDGYIFDRTHNLIKPGLDADRVAATRDANVRKAAHLMLRLAKFDPNQPIYRRRERSASSILPQQGEVSPKDGGATEGAPAFPTGFASAFPTSAPHPFAFTSHFPLPTSDIDECSAASTSPKGEVRPQAGVGAPAFSPGFAPAFPTSSSCASSSRLSVFTSDIPLPTSDFEPDPESEPDPEPSPPDSS